MARVWPPSRLMTNPLSQHTVELPPQDIQDRLIELYFTNFHPSFPVIHKTRFLTEYNARFFFYFARRVLSVSDLFIPRKNKYII